MAGALIVTAEIGQPDFGWLDGLRRAYFPPERNVLKAHLTMFHALPPSAEHELRHRLSEFGREPRPKATIEGLMDLGGGVAYRVVSPELDMVRAELAELIPRSAERPGCWRLALSRNDPEQSAAKGSTGASRATGA